MKRCIIVLSAAVLAAVSLFGTPVRAQEGQRCPETSDRLPSDQLEELVADPIALVEADDLEGGKQAFEALLSQRMETQSKILVADTLIGFGVALHGVGTGDPEFQKNALPYLRRAVDAYLEIFGPDHPEVALAWASLGDAALSISPDEPTDEAVSALQRAHEIRMRQFGINNVETAANLAVLAKAFGEPARTLAEEAKIAASDAMFREALDGARTLRCDHYLGRSIPRDHLAMLVRNGKLEAAMARFDELSKTATKDEAVGLVGDFIRTLKKAGLDDEVRQVEARFPDAALKANDPFFILMGIFDPTD